MVISISGHGFSGSGAVYDLLKEYSDISFIEHEEEFNFLYMPDGILDLEYHLVLSPQRFFGSDVAINRFLQLAKKISFEPNGIYMRSTKGNFYEITKNYVDSITQLHWKGYWNNDLYHCNEIVKTLKYRIFDRQFSKIENKIGKKLYTFLDRNMYLSVRPDNFYDETKKYLKMLLKYMGGDVETDKLVINQLFAGNNPESGMQFFDDARTIVVERDPRDIYLLVKRHSPSATHWIASDSVGDFIKYYKYTREKVNYCSDKVLFIQFEDLLFKNKETVKCIEGFLDICNHDREGQIFKPQISINNTKLFLDNKKYESDIKIIEAELKEYLYDFPEKEIWERNGKGIF